MKHLPLSNDYEQLEMDFKQWLEVLGYATATVKSLPVHVRELLHYLECHGVKHISEAKETHLYAFAEYLSNRTNKTYGGALSACHINKQVQSMHTFMSYLRQTGRHEIDCSLKRLEEATEDKIILSTLEIQALYQATYEQPDAYGQRSRAMIAVFYGCGLRRSEGIALDIRDIDLQKQTVLVAKGKGNKQRYVPIAGMHADDLEKYISKGRKELQQHTTCQALFLNKEGNRMRDFYGMLKWLRMKAGIEKRFGLHALRHSIATHLLASGMDMEGIARFLGHSSLASTQVYTHIVKKSNAEWI
jgi:integrase/recombinase XerD